MNPRVARDDRSARLAWSRIAEPGLPEVARWIAEHGAIGALERLAAGRLVPDGRFDARLATLDLESAWRGVARANARVVVPSDDDWPTGLDDLEVPPVCLFVRGSAHLATAAAGSVAVVGSRAATEYGITVAHDLGADLADRGVTVVSGAAFGIDAAAHRGALAVDGTTVAVLACGVDRPYPAAHRTLLDAVAEDGVVVSEVAIGHAPYRGRFLARNRLIATMTVGTVVVEAGLRSGSLNTARHAREALRHVAAVPGPVTSPTSAGCHELVRTHGATLVTDAAEVLDLMGRLGLDLAPVRRAPVTPDGELDAVSHAVWSAVPVRSPADLERLRALTGLAPASILAALGRLDADGLVARHGDGWRKVPAGRGRPRVPR
ncbi:MAG TPA: DNA-processing protein DprA [Dermatophilaceae bacterium]|nr:DNA-processing protein DprA [Dermatophilaceae bacterium]